mmetsp:Transcript_4257/g.9529  ORF Transcript_4257/g.9529 Transcript_4257/m.9529 type:complete len:173 (+) Transcript_4257:319-837(+)
MCLPNGLQPGAVKARCSRAAVRPASSPPPSSRSETNGSDLCRIMRNCISMEQSSMTSAALRRQNGHLIADESSYHRSSSSSSPPPSTEVDVSVLCIAAGDVRLIDLDCDAVGSSVTLDDAKAEGVGKKAPRAAGENAPAPSGTDRGKAINKRLLLLWSPIAILPCTNDVDEK